MEKIKAIWAKWDKVILFAVGTILAVICSFIETIDVCCLPTLVVSFLFETGVATNYCEKPNITRWLATNIGALAVQMIVLL